MFGHLFIEELRNALERIWYLIRHKQEAESPGGKVRGDALPEAVGIRLSVRLKQRVEDFVRLKAPLGGRLLERFP